MRNCRSRARRAGVAVKRSSSARRISLAVRRVLDDPAYQEGAARLGAAIRRDAANERIIAALEAGLCSVELSEDLPDDLGGLVGR